MQAQELPWGTDGGAQSDRGTIEVHSGPLSVEDALLEALASELAAGRRAPSLLAKPVVVAVPSDSLRVHLAARLVERAGGAIAGLSIVTLHGLAQRILQRAGEPAKAGTSLTPLLVRELARAEPLLFDRLDSLVDGYAAVEQCVADLLDAGMEPVHLDGLDERLADLAVQRVPCEIARAVVRVAGGVAQAQEDEALASRSLLLRRAAERMEEEPGCLSARAVFVHGFSDATGRASDLIAGLLHYHAARVFIDEPPDLATGQPLRTFVSHLRERLESWGDVSRPPPAPHRPRVLRCIEAPGAGAELRAVAASIALLLRGGALPESVGVVARDVADYATPLRVHFSRLGVPFSGLAPVDAGRAAARRTSALLAVLRQRERCPTDRWLDALQGLGGLGGEPLPRPDHADLRSGLRHLGAARFGQVSELARGPHVGARGVALPVRRGLEAHFPEPMAAGEGDEPSAPATRVSAARRWLSVALLGDACAAAGSALARLESAAVGSFESHAQRIRALAGQDLGWQPDAPESEELNAQLDELLCDAPQVEVPFDDFVYLLARGLAKAGREPVGGQGGGVQVLSVMEARARTFSHLFVLGMNRDVFPRSIREDPLLADSLRRSLAEMLPDIPIKRRGYDEERHLFAQLLAASPRVTLSWQSAGDDGRVRAPSTLVERLRWALPDLVVETAPSLHTPAGPEVPIPAHERAQLAALYGERDSLAEILEVAFIERADRAAADDEPARSVPAIDPRRLAAVRLAVIREFDAAPGAAPGCAPQLGPYFGFVGRVGQVASDPRHAKAYVTGLEELARCPWKSFLERTLRIEPLPDPIESLPEVDALLVGSAVHRVLERMARDVLPHSEKPLAEPPDLADLDPTQTASLRWPGDPEVWGMLREEAQQLLGLDGVPEAAGLVDVLVAKAWPKLERARDLEWATPEMSVSVAGVELEGHVSFPARVHAADSQSPGSQAPDDDVVYFRADRIDILDGELVLTDYKTGRPLSSALRPDTRRKHFEAAVRGGGHLQAAAYAQASPGAVGRYLYLDPDGEPEHLEYRTAPDDRELAANFERAAGALLAARREGSFAPRLVERDGIREPALCSRCNVAEACLRGDSGARRRMAAWLASEEPAGASAAEAALREVWDLASHEAVKA